MMKKLISLMLALTMVLSMAACGSEPQETTPNETPAQTTDAVDVTPETTVPQETEAELNNTLVEYYMQKANEVVVTETDVTFTDDSGRGTITIAKNPQNAAVLYGSLACLWYEAGGVSPILIGGKSAVSLYKEQVGRDITQDEGAIVVAESSSGTQWDVEAIVANHPDLIICSMGMKGYETIGATAEAAGIPVIGIQYDHVQDYLKWFKVFCNINGQPELWDEIANATAEKIIEVVSKVPAEGEKPTVLALNVSNGKVKAYGTEAAVGTILYELGAVNVADQDPENHFESVEIDLEQIYAWNPDLIMVVNRSTDNATQEGVEELLGTNEVWLNLDAVKNGDLYYLDMRLFFNKPNWRYQEAYESMAQILYPEIFG